MKKRILSILVALALAFGLFGCQKTPVETQPSTQETTQPTETTVPEPTAPDALTAYGEARAAMESEAGICLDITVHKDMTLGDEVFYTRSEQVLTYATGEDDKLLICMEEKFDNGEPEEEPEEEEWISYSEVWTNGTLYTQMEDTYYFSAALAEEEADARYVPAAMLDESLYGSVTSELEGEKVRITFSQPTAGEAWAVPEGAELLEASGEAIISEDGELEEMRYIASYNYGTASYNMEVVSAPRQEPPAAAAPENPEEYVQLQYADALRDYMDSLALLMQSDAMMISGVESVTSQAAGAVRNQSVSMDLCGREEELMTKIDHSVFFMDSNGQEEWSQEETYRDGKYTVKVDDGLPTTHMDVELEAIEEYCLSVVHYYMADPFFWSEAAIEDLGSVYLVSYVFTEDFGNNVQNSVCEMFWEDAAFLNNLASAYESKELTGYLAFEKYTGLPTAAGFYYEGVHTIDGREYILSVQADQSMTAPSFGSYHEITEERLPETEPENKATPLFYHVTGQDGQEMWLLGTIHVGDERTGFLPQEIYDAFAASDALALEINSEAFDEQVEEDDALQEEVSGAYYYSDSTAAEHVDEETYEKAVKYMKASGNYTMNTPYMKLSVWSNSIENFYLRMGHQLTGEQGVEERLTALAEEQEKEIREVESSLFQIKMSTGWSEELQKLMLEETLESNAREYWEGVYELYEMWCAGDESALREELSDEVDTSEMTEEELAEYNEYLPLLEEYNKAMSYDRNDGMLEVAIEYLESGEVVFYAVGLAHLLNDVNGLVDTLREAGYTVELVEYK